MSSKYLPVDNPTLSFWESEDDGEFRNTRSTKELPETTDVLIIGAGYSGAATAFWINKQCEETKRSPPSMLMLEARSVASAATGRNGGNLKPDYYREYLKFERLYGMKEAASIGNFEKKHISALKGIIEELDIDCDFVLSRTCNVHVTETSVANAKKGIAALKKNPYSEAFDDLQVLEGNKAEVTSLCDSCPLSVTFTAAHLWPYKMVKGFLEYCLERGLNLQTHTPATKITQSKDGSYTVETKRGVVEAKKIVLATNGYTVSIAPEFEDKIVPVKGTCSHIKVTDDHEHAPYLNSSYAFARDFSEHEYLINRPDGTIVVGGAKPYYLKDKDSWYKNVDDSTLFDGDVKGFYSEFMQKHFYTWKSYKTEVDYLWTGILGYSVDALPFVGEVPGSKNKFILAGFHGHGMPRIFLSAKAISEMILNGVSVQETEIPRTFMLTKTRLDAAKNNILKESGYYQYHPRHKI